MTRSTEHLTVRVNKDQSVTLLTDDAVLHLGEFAVYDLIDSLASMDYADYMLTTAQQALDAELDEVTKNVWHKHNSLAENE